MIRVPRAVLQKYWPLPYADVLAAAKSRCDGLVECGPKRMRQGDWPLYPPVKPFNYDGDDRARQTHDRNVEEFDFDLGHAYLREGTDHRSKGMALLFQQGW